MIKNIFRKDLQSVEPYKASTFKKDMIKLDAGENPYVEKFLEKTILSSIPFYLYPDAYCTAVRKKLSEYTNMDADWILCGNGSDELIDLIIRSCINKNDEIIICPPTFSMYAFYGQLGKAKIKKVLRKIDLTIDVGKVLKAISPKTKIVFIDSPGNPTSTVVSEKDIVMLLKGKIVVVVDEAYYEYCGKTVLPLVKTYENLIVLRTLSKWAGLAGLRIGYMVANPKIIKAFFSIKPPYNVNIIAQKMAESALENKEEILSEIKKIIDERPIIIKELEKIPQLKVYLSEGAYILFKPITKATELKDYLKSKGILVKIINQPLLKNCIRINIGKEKEMQKVIRVIKRFYNNKYAFLDRDGTLIFEPQDTFQIDSIEKLKILDGAVKGLRKLIDLGYGLIMITNQDGLGTPSFSRTNFDGPQNMMLRIFEENGIMFKGVFICPHLPSKNCDCRKPKLGLVKNFLKRNRLDINNSFVCGDRSTDELFAKNIGVKFIPMQTNGDFYKALEQGGIVI